MQNRSNDNIPVFFTHHETYPRKTSHKPHIVPLQIYDFTFLHFHDFLEIGYCVKGKGICRVEDAEQEFKKGDVEIIFPFQKHLSKNLGKDNSEWYWININPYEFMKEAGFSNAPALEKLMFSEMALSGIFSPKEYPTVVDLVKKLLQEMLQPEGIKSYHAELCASYLYQLLIELARLSTSLPKLEIFHDRQLSTLGPALDMISDGVIHGNIPTVVELATSCGMSISNFRKVFQKVLGIAPKDYIIQNFLYKAQQLLITTDKNIAEICMETGYRELSTFNRQFASKLHMTPSEFRMKYKKEKDS